MPYTLVLFHAHPDDEAIATGGTMARATSDGHRVVLVSATRGELGEHAPDSLGAGRRACRPPGRRTARGGRDPRRRPGRVPRLPRLGHGRRADERRAGLVRAAPTSTKPRPGSRRSSRGARRRAHRSTTRTATTATPITSRCTSSACAPPSSPEPSASYEATVNRDHIKRLMDAVAARPRRARSARRSRHARRDRGPDHHDRRRPRVRRPQA